MNEEGEKESASPTRVGSRTLERLMSVKQSNSQSISPGRAGSPTRGGHVEGLYQELNESVVELDKKIESILAQNEKDFLSAYKMHMLRVQNELKILKGRANEGEMKNQRDDQLTKIEESMKWFRDEALNLGDACNEQKKEIEKWKNRVEHLEEDRKFLEHQIQESKRVNKILKTQLHKQSHVNQGSEIDEQNPRTMNDTTSTVTRRSLPPSERKNRQSGSNWRRGHSTAVAKSPNRLDQRTRVTGAAKLLKENLTTKETKFDEFSAHRERIKSLITTNWNDEEMMLCKLDKYLWEFKCQQEEDTNELKAIFEQERQKNTRLKTQRANIMTNKNELEAFFLDCVDEVRKEILRRRSGGQSYSNYSVEGGIGRGPMNYSAELSSLGMQRSSAASGEFMSEFPGNPQSSIPVEEQRRILELMISNENILYYLYEKMFPHRSSRMNSMLESQKKAIAAEIHTGRSSKSSSKRKSHRSRKPHPPR
mmetsp:Transcript_31542/g.35850  ORF Transcript_31542/g.35850 Transcript_31542/m.35850 type:complete len:480 (+) Transcript_31542:41-1480(+)